MTRRPPSPAAEPHGQGAPLLLGSGPSQFEATRQPSKGHPETADLRPNPLTGTGATVVLSYHDLDDADDVPDSGATIAAGFSTDSSFYIGNGALNALDIAEAEMCVWYESAGSCVSNCEVFSVVTWTAHFLFSVEM